MGKSLSDRFAESRAVFAAADSALGESLSATCFEGTAEQLALTENTQPAILTSSVAALRALAERGIRPVATAGHSLGEYSAHVAAGTFEFEDAVRTVRSRGKFMQEAVPVGEGAMAAILGLANDEVERICGDAGSGRVVSPANYNAPGQVVISGHTDAVERAMSAALEAGAKRSLRLPVSAPFHCSLMKPAAERMVRVLDEIEIRDPAIPVYTNVDARPVESADDVRDALLRQIPSPVLWEQLAGRMCDAGIDTVIEIGPGRVLTGLMRRIRKGVRSFNVENADDVEKVVAELEV